MCRILEDQLEQTVAAMRAIPDERSLHRYAPDKWSIREVLNHLSDTERVFAFRASGSRTASTARSRASIRTSP